MKRIFAAVTLLLMCIAPSTQSRSYAQNTQASLTGQILDTQGASLSGAQVEIINSDTNISRVAVSDSAGRYLISNLNPGKYSLHIEMQGFS